MLEAELKQIEADMAASASDTKRITALSLQYGEVQDMLHSRYDDWASVAG